MKNKIFNMKEAKVIYTKMIKINTKRKTATITIPKQVIKDYDLTDGDKVSIYRTNDLLNLHETTNKNNCIDNKSGYKQQLQNLTSDYETLKAEYEAQHIKLRELERLKQQAIDRDKLLELLMKYLTTELDLLTNDIVTLTTIKHKENLADTGIWQRLTNNIDLTINDVNVDELKNETRVKLVKTIKELKE